MKKIEPKYEFVAPLEGENLSPVHQKIAKTMEVTETFNMYDVMVYLANLKKARDQKIAEVEGLDAMIKNFEDEMVLINKVLKVDALEEEFQKEHNEKSAEAVPSPYVGEGPQEEVK